MMQVWLFLGISFIIMNLVLLISKIKGIRFHTLISLFLFGIALSIPFIMVELLGSHMKFYFVILAFIAIELGVLYFEHHVKAFHDLVHHNVKHLRIISFLLIGIGFTYSEVAATIFHHQRAIHELLTAIPLKVIFGMFIHTALTSLASLVHVGALFTESVLESVFRFFSYYLRIALISLSHYFYVFFTEHELSLYVLPFLTLNIVFFFWAKDYLDKKKGELPD